MTTPRTRPTLVTRVPRPITVDNFTIDSPVLSRGTADRDEMLRDPSRLTGRWPSARLVAVGPTGKFAAVGERPAWTRATGECPPEGAVLLGTVDGVDHWGVPDTDVDGPTLRELGALLGDADAGLLVTAVALLGWHARGGFCPVCGEPSTPAPAGWSRTCRQGHQEFPRTDPAVIVLVHDGADKMVLARAPSWAPHRFSVLAGFTETGESLEATVVREIGEEVGLAVTDIRYLGSQPWPFPRSLMVGFAARAEQGAEFSPQDGEIAEARWVSRDTVRRVLARSGWTGPADTGDLRSRTGDAERVRRVGRPRRPGDTDDFDLPASISIARRMIEGWAGIG